MNLDSLDLPLSEKLEVVMDGYKNLDGGNFTFNPAFWDLETENPFKLTERNYPVDLGSTIDHRLSLLFHFPENFTVSQQPNPVGIALPNKAGRFITSIEVSGNTISYSQVEQLNKAIYTPEEYPYLKELFNKIIQNQKANIVFKKNP